MLRKFSGEEIIKGIVSDYPKIKDEFKQVLYDNGFRWQKDSYQGNGFGMEGLWINYGYRLSIRARWGKVNTNAIIYVEKEFFDKVKKFFDLYLPNDGMDPENYDYDLLNQGKLFKKDDKDDKKVGNKKRKDKKDKTDKTKDKSNNDDNEKSKSEGNMSSERLKQVMEENEKDHPSTRVKRVTKGKCKECKEE